MPTLKDYLFIIVFIQGLHINAQESDLYNWFDDEVGLENTNLYNGIEFINRYNPIDGKHRFFESEFFEIGNVRYNNQNYYNVPLRYDLHEDQLIVRLESPLGTNQILLLREKVELFKIGKSNFFNLESYKDNDELLSGFFQLMTKNKHVTLFKKNHKKVSKGIKNNTVYYEFIEVEPEYFIKIKGQVFQIKKKKDLISKFPEYRKELSRFKWNSKDYNKNDNQLISAINNLGQILDQ